MSTSKTKHDVVNFMVVCVRRVALLPVLAASLTLGCSEPSQEPASPRQSSAIDRDAITDFVTC